MATVTEPLSTTGPETATDSPHQESEAGTLFELRHRITVAEYHRMLDAEVFGRGARVELLEGLVIDKMTKNNPHVVATDLLDYLMHRLLPAGYFISMGNPVTIEDRHSEPEPDASILRGTPRDFTNRRHTPADAVLLIEVSETSYAIDRHHKSVTYAASGVPVYWILDLNRRRLEVRTNPVNQGDQSYYAKCEILTDDQEVGLVLDGAEHARFAVRDILP